MANFAVDYCLQFMEVLQGRKAPLKVKLFLIVNPPRWFNKVWAITMKPMLAPSFRKKVHMIPEKDLMKFLQPGFEKHLPDEFAQGRNSVEQLASDYVTFRRYVEDKAGSRMPCEAHTSLLRSHKTGEGRQRRSAKGKEELPDATHSSGLGNSQSSESESSQSNV